MVGIKRLWGRKERMRLIFLSVCVFIWILLLRLSLDFVCGDRRSGKQFALL